MSGISRSTLFILERVRRKLEEGLDLNDPLALAWLCEQLREVAYHVHEEFLKRGDEVKAIQVFENFYLPLDRMAKIFEGLSRVSRRA